jgi:hypothetical protein
VLAPYVAALMGRHALATMEDLDRARGGANIDLSADQRMGNRVEEAVDLDVVVEIDARAAPLGELPVVGGKRRQRAALIFSNSSRRLAENDFRNPATDRWRIINSDFAEASDFLYALRAFMEAANHEVTRDEFVAFASRLHGGIVKLRDVSWASRIVAAQRARFETETRATLFSEFEIREFAGGVLVRARCRRGSG